MSRLTGKVEKLEREATKRKLERPEAPIKYIIIIDPETGEERDRYTLPWWKDVQDEQT